MNANKVVLITGGSRGIGRAAAKLFAKQGWQVAVGYRSNREAAESLLAEIKAIGGKAATFQADLQNRSEAFRLANETREAFGVVDVLINNAGIAQQKLFTDLTEADWQEMLAVNLMAAVHLSAVLLPDMIRGKRGKILNISSVWGMTGAACEVHYSTAKAALIGLTKALAKEVGPSGICVNCVAPGIIETDMCGDWAESDRAALADETPLCRLGKPEDIAQTLLFLAGPGGDFITGQVISPNGGFII